MTWVTVTSMESPLRTKSSRVSAGLPTVRRRSTQNASSASVAWTTSSRAPLRVECEKRVAVAGTVQGPVTRDAVHSPAPGSSPSGPASGASAGGPPAARAALRIGGRPRALLECATPEAVSRAVGILDGAGVPVLVLGGGSNLVVGGGDLPMVVVAVRNRDVAYGDEPATVRAGAGLTWDELVADTVARGRGGLECLSGIPGSVGATPVQNVGAYGVEVAQVLRRVRLHDRATGVDAWVPPSELGLAYRTSVLKNTDRAVVLEVEFDLRADGLSEPIRYAELAARPGVAPGARADAALGRATVRGLRRGKAMVLDDDAHDTWSAGSFFTTPVVPAEQVADVRRRVGERLGEAESGRMPAFDAPGGVKLSAGWLIERAGFGKGHPSSSSPARLSTKHALALTNQIGRAACRKRE